MLIIKIFITIFVFLFSTIHCAEEYPQENITLESTPFKQFENYKNTAKLAKEQYEYSFETDDSTSEKVAKDLLYRFWLSPLEAPLTDEERKFFEAIFDLLIWPKYNTTGGGDINHPKGSQLFTSFAEFPLSVRKIILINNLPFLYIHWLNTMKELNIDCQFYPIFIERLIEKPIQLQELISTDRTFTFTEVFLILNPKKNDKRQERVKTIEAATDSSAPSLSLIEAEAWVLSYFVLKDYGIKVIEKIFKYATELAVDGQNIHFEHQVIKDILNNLIQEKASAKAIQFAVSVYLGAHDKKDEKTAIFNELMKTLKSSEAMTLTVDSYASYCYGEKNSSYLKLISREFSPQTRKLAIALHVGCPTEGIDVGATKLKISGVKKENFQALCKVLSCVSDSNVSSTIRTLDLSSNHLLSLDPLILSLTALPGLKKLILRDNPLFTLQSVVENLPNLKTIVIQDTYIPKFSLFNVVFLSSRRELKRSLIASTEPIVPDHFNIMPEKRCMIFNSHCEYLANDWIKRKDWEDKIGEEVGDTGISYLEMHTSVMQQLGENFWKESLALGIESWSKLLGSNKINQGDEIDDLLELLNKCKATQGQAAHKLPFAIKFGFPSGTVEKGLIFDKDMGITPSPTCLTKIAISDAPVMPKFLGTLAQFSHLIELSLTNINLKNLDSLPCMPLLKSLILSHNRITNLREFRRGQDVCKFPNLRKLKLDHNGLPSHDRLDLLLDFEKLVYLKISFNELRDISRLKPLRGQLLYLDLRNNYIAEKDLINWQPIKEFSGDPQYKDESLS